mmetsp:Transcript_18392/g.25298  ORF Transcript_18392/g.25298 Transcript_18392/m.25298 type:complete len:88 (-) Transcript_18392:593-856(-)
MPMEGLQLSEGCLNVANAFLQEHVSTEEDTLGHLGPTPTTTYSTRYGHLTAPGPAEEIKKAQRDRTERTDGRTHATATSCLYMSVWL